MKIQNGETRNVIIPAEYEFRGWKKSGECLQRFFTKNNIMKSTVASSNQKRREFQQAHVRVGEETDKLGRDTRLVAVIVKNRSQTSRRTIKVQM